MDGCWRFRLWLAGALIAIFGFDTSLASSSSKDINSLGDPPEEQRCAGRFPDRKGFFCSQTQQCESSFEDSCPDPRVTPKCETRICNDKTSGNGETIYEVRLGRVPLIDCSSSSVLKDQKFPEDTSGHWFVDYRGFAYEFGGSYDMQVLDKYDPEYKYARECYNENTLTWRDSKWSSCNQSQVNEAVNYWYNNFGTYDILSNNCQNFGQDLFDHIAGNCPPKMVTSCGTKIGICDCSAVVEICVHCSRTYCGIKVKASVTGSIVIPWWGYVIGGLFVLAVVIGGLIYVCIKLDICS